MMKYSTENPSKGPRHIKPQWKLNCFDNRWNISVLFKTERHDKLTRHLTASKTTRTRGYHDSGNPRSQCKFESLTWVNDRRRNLRQTTVRGLQVKTKGCSNKIYGILYISLEDLNERRKKQAKVWRHSKITRSGNNLLPLIIGRLLVDVIRDSQSVFSEIETSPLYRNPRPWVNLYFRCCARLTVLHINMSSGIL